MTEKYRKRLFWDRVAQYPNKPLWFVYGYKSEADAMDMIRKKCLTETIRVRKV